jgi:hypothetical protein
MPEHRLSLQEQGERHRVVGVVDLGCCSCWSVLAEPGHSEFGSLLVDEGLRRVELLDTLLAAESP